MFEEIKNLELKKVDAEIASINLRQKEVFDEFDQLKTQEPQYKSYSWIQKNITKRREYKEYNQTYNELYDAYSSKLQSNLRSMDEVTAEMKRLDCKRELIKNSESLRELGISSLSYYHEYCKDNNIEEDLETIFVEYPEESCSNKDYMMHAIQVDPFNIRYDLTNDLDVYRAAAQILYTYLNTGEYVQNRELYSRWVMDMLDMLNDESFINSETGSKFIEYIKEILRTMNPDKLYIPDIKEAYYLYNTEYGHELEELYQNPDIIVGVHGTSYYEEDNKILRDGIKTSSQDDRALNNLSRTVAYDIPFIRLLTYDGSQYAGAKLCMRYNYIVKIPREAFEPNSVTPIWGGNSEFLSQDYLLPELVCGVYDTKSDGAKMKTYEGKKTRYERLYLDGSKKPLEVGRKL